MLMEKHQNVLPREVVYHVISDEPTHVDFLKSSSWCKN